MCKYKKGDKVVIKKDLVPYGAYGTKDWSNQKEILKNKKYVIIEEINEKEEYLTEKKFWITEEMIEGLYKDLYYITIKGNETDVLHINRQMKHEFKPIGMLDDSKFVFTTEECEEIIGTSTILYKKIQNQ